MEKAKSSQNKIKQTEKESGTYRIISILWQNLNIYRKEDWKKEYWGVNNQYPR